MVVVMVAVVRPVPPLHSQSQRGLSLSLLYYSIRPGLGAEHSHGPRTLLSSVSPCLCVSVCVYL